jgi:hypothetical protein
MDEIAATFTPSNDGTASYTANGVAQTATTYSGSDEERYGGLLITNDNYYIADVNGVRIIVGGFPADGIDSTSVTWTPDTDIA